MVLTSAQLATLKADIQANSDSNTLYVAGNYQGLANLYNVASNPAFIAWKTLVSLPEVGAKFNGSELANLTSANLQRLQTIGQYNPNGVNPSLSDTRSFFTDI